MTCHKPPLSGFFYVQIKETDMIVLYGPTQLAHIPNSDIRNLVSTRFKQILGGDNYDYDLHGYMIVVEPDDTVFNTAQPF